MNRHLPLFASLTLLIGGLITASAQETEETTGTSTTTTPSAEGKTAGKEEAVKSFDERKESGEAKPEAAAKTATGAESTTEAATTTEEGAEGEEPPTYTPVKGGVVDLAFGANLDKLDTACHRDEPAGCAIHTAVLDLDSKAVSQVKLLDRHETMGTWFPTWIPNGSFVLFEQVQWKGGQSNVIIGTNTTSKSRSLLAEYGRFPSVNGAGTQLVYSLPTDQGGIFLADIKVGEGGKMVLNNKTNISETRVTGSHHGEDAQFVPGSDAVVFHQKGDNTKSGVIGLKEGSPKFPSEKLQGCGHTAVSPDGSMFICGLSSGEGTYAAKKNADGSWGEMALIFPALSQEAYTEGSSYYADSRCERILMSYPEFCATNDRLIASAQCASVDDTGHATIQFSRMLLIEFNPADNTVPAKITDLTERIEGAAGVEAGKSQAVTASCRKK